LLALGPGLTLVIVISLDHLSGLLDEREEPAKVEKREREREREPRMNLLNLCPDSLR
jgi:hypothetical protein